MNRLDEAKLLLLLDRKKIESSGMILSITSPKFGPLAGFVPDVSSGVRRFILDDDRFFGPYIGSL
jgi:hypothetical protein